MTDAHSLHVLYLIDQLYSGRGGSEQHLMWLLKTLPKRGIHVDLVVMSNLRACSPEDLPIPIRILGREFGEGKMTYLKRFRELVRIIREYEIDVVHAFTPRDEFVGAFACYFAGRASLCSQRRDIGYDLNRMKKWMSRITQCFKIPYIANSKAAQKSACQNEKIPSNRFSVIYNPVFGDRKKEGEISPISRSQLGISETAPLLVQVATIRSIKGYEVLLRAASILVQKHSNLKILCVGEPDESYQTEMRNLAQELNVSDHVIWFGGIDNPFRILPQCDVAVLSSHSESFSNAVLEYGAAGLPIVATDVGGMREIITDSVTGLIVPPNEPAQLAEKIDILLSDKEKAKLFGDAIQKFVMEHFTEECVTKEYISFYQKVALGQNNNKSAPSAATGECTQSPCSGLK
ncbi:MAG: glycosyltransferase family 4 protein [Thermoguttaceae bacterium]